MSQLQAREREGDAFHLALQRANKGANALIRQHARRLALEFAALEAKCFSLDGGARRGVREVYEFAFAAALDDAAKSVVKARMEAGQRASAREPVASGAGPAAGGGGDLPQRQQVDGAPP